MERSLRIIASSLVLLCGILPALADDPAPDASSTTEEALCDAAAGGLLRLDDAQLLRCRRLWQQRVAAARTRSQGYLERMREEDRLRRELQASLPPPPPPPVTVETFLGGDLAYGDVVVTDKGPRVFVGKAGVPARSEDFVTLDSGRSPHRGNAKPYDGAHPQPPRPQAAKPRTTALKPQERKP
ncbi:hypothetical protein [uncultured Bosea sp.]|uniref:hypothetical protein n=1 Tax=uncultured Bosea sp. TaxID=211457 RepID=UPI00263AF963|nr:hypothetical protein [uncultured Bosea sp.]